MGVLILYGDPKVQVNIKPGDLATLKNISASIRDQEGFPFMGSTPGDLFFIVAVMPPRTLAIPEPYSWLAGFWNTQVITPQGVIGWIPLNLGEMQNWEKVSS